MSEERLQEIKDSVNFQREILLAHNMGTLCVDEEQELIEEIERLNKRIEIKNNRIQQLMKRTRSARIDKAIEYIVNNSELFDEDTFNDLLVILQGSDKE